MLAPRVAPMLAPRVAPMFAPRVAPMFAPRRTYHAHRHLRRNVGVAQPQEVCSSVNFQENRTGLAVLGLRLQDACPASTPKALNTIAWGAQRTLGRKCLSTGTPKVFNNVMPLPDREALQEMHNVGGREVHRLSYLLFNPLPSTNR